MAAENSFSRSTTICLIRKWLPDGMLEQEMVGNRATVTNKFLDAGYVIESFEIRRTVLVLGNVKVVVSDS